MTAKKKIIGMALCLALTAAATEQAHAIKSYGAGKTLNVTQAKTMAMENSSAYQKLQNKLALSQVKYQEAVKSIRLKKKNMASFRWTPLLSFKFPEKPDLAEEFEFTYKPMQIQSEINGLRHEMSVVQYDVYETVGNQFTEAYTLQETIGFYEEQLEMRQEDFKRIRARLLAGCANADDAASLEKAVRSLEQKTAGKVREFEKAKKKLGEQINLDVRSGYRFLNPYMETDMSRADLAALKEHTLAEDQGFYEVKAAAQLQRIALDTNYSMMRSQYGGKMDRLDSFLHRVKNGGSIDSGALKAQYDKLLEDVDAPWQGNIKILFIKSPKEWFKGQISGVRYVEDEPYTLYTNILEYQEAVKEEADAKKELLDMVEESYDTVITAKNAYDSLKEEVDSLEQEVELALVLNRAGSLSLEELTALQEMYEENQLTLLETLSSYTQALYSLEGLSCGVATSLMYEAGTSPKAAQGGDSLVEEEQIEGASYHIRTYAEENLFEIWISIPEGYGLEITSFELWIDNVKIGERTSLDQRLRHLALDKEQAEKVVLRLYQGDTFMDDCVIDPAEYEGPLSVAGSYGRKEEEDLTVAKYQVQAQENGMMSIAITPVRPAGEEAPAYYSLENQEGKQLFGGSLIPMEQPFTYLSLLNGSLEELKVRFYDGNQGELYQAEFDPDSLSLKKEETP